MVHRTFWFHILDEERFGESRDISQSRAVFNISKHRSAREAGADIQSKVGELEELNESLRNRDKMKDDAIAQLSDQLMALTARMQELERKQQV